MGGRLPPLAGLALASALTSVAGGGIGSELILNGGAETGDTSGWVSSGIDAVPASGASSGFGVFTFHGGTGPAAGQGLFQAVDVSAHAVAIDANLVTSTFLVYIQSRTAAGIDDIGSAVLQFHAESGDLIESVEFIDPPEADPVWELYADTRSVPVGTRTVAVHLWCIREGGESTDAFFDDVSLVLSGPVACPPDLNNSGAIDSGDLNVLLGDFGCSGGACAGDVDGDGDTDSGDLNLLLASFGEACG